MRARIHRQTEVRAAWQKVEQAPDAEAALRACGELLLLDPGDPKVVERIWGLSGRLADATEREVRQQAELKERAEEAEMLTQMLRDQERNFADLRRWSAEKLKAQADATAVERGELEKKLRDAQRREDELGRKSQANVAKYRQESEELRKEQARLEKEMEVRKAALAEANRLEQELKAAVETQRVTLPPIGRPLG